MVSWIFVNKKKKKNCLSLRWIHVLDLQILPVHKMYLEWTWNIKCYVFCFNFNQAFSYKLDPRTTLFTLWAFTFYNLRIMNFIYKATYQRKSLLLFTMLKFSVTFSFFYHLSLLLWPQKWLHSFFLLYPPVSATVRKRLKMLNFLNFLYRTDSFY